MNFVEKYLSFAEPLTEAPRTFHYYMGYMILSMGVGRRVRYSRAGSLSMAPNLWMIFLGTSSLTKKSTTLRIGTEHVLRHVFKEMPFKYPAEGSHEAFVELMSERPEGLMAHSEFASLMNWLRRDYNSGLMSLLTDLYDQQPDYERRVGTRDKKKSFVIKNPFVNIVSCSTLEWFNQSLEDESAIQGGFLPRFILVVDKSGKDLPMTPPPDFLLRDKLVDELQMIQERYEEPLDLTYEPAAAKMHDEWYVNFKRARINGAPSGVSSFNSRRQSDLHKFAMLNCVMRGGSTMTVADLDGAIGIVEQLSEYVSEVISGKLAFTPYQVTRQKVMDLIEKFSAGNGGAPRKKVMQYAKIKVREFEEIISSLDAEGAISIQEKKGENGKKMLSYKPVAQEEEANGV